MTPLLWSLAFLLVGAVLHYLSEPNPPAVKGSPTLKVIGLAGIWSGVVGLLLVLAGPL